MTTVAARQDGNGAPDDGRMLRLTKKRTTRKPKTLILDPEDLTRRLEVVVAERKAYDERKRTSRANIDRANQCLTSSPEKRKGREAPPDGAPYPVEDPNPIRAAAARRSAHSTKYLSMVDPGPPELPQKDDVASIDEPFYQHIPVVAASQHIRTTTISSGDNQPLVHKLSRRAMDFHLNGPIATQDANSNTTAGEYTRNLERVHGERTKVYGRNQFQHPARFDDPGDLRQSGLANRHSMDPFPARQPGDEGEHVPAHRSSLYGLQGSTRVDQELAHTAGTEADSLPRQHILPIPTYTTPFDDHRVDWTQADERARGHDQQSLPKGRPRWRLKAHLNFHRHSASERDMLTPVQAEPALAVKTSKSGFFTRFKR